ncbi:MarR family winged helix-turn-helix transcriptional regulator [Bacteroidota bacterium]
MKYIFENSVGKLCQEVSHSTGKLLCTLFKKQGYDISSPEWIVLAYLNQYKILNQNNLSDIILRDKVFVKRLMDKMEEDNYVKRTKNRKDNRFNDISLTVKGEELYIELSAIAEQTLELAYNNISEDELRRGIDFLKFVNGNLNTVLADKFC